MAQFEQRDFIVADGVIHADIAGPADGETVLFLHGWTLDRRFWRPQLEALCQDVRAVAIDRRGFGRTTAPASVIREPDDIQSIQDQLGVERIVLVAMSQAGRIALAYARRHPDRVRALVLQGIGLDGVDPDPVAEQEIPLALYTELVRSGRIDAMKRLWAGHELMRIAPGRSRARLADMMRDYDGRDLLQDTSGMRFPVEALAEIATDALIVTGAAETPWRRRVAQLLVLELGHAREVVVPGGHLCSATHPDGFNDALRGFLAGLDQEGGVRDGAGEPTP